MTSIEWLATYLKGITSLNCDEVIEQAKEMHKQEMAQLPQQEISDEEIEKAAFEYIKPPRQTPEKSDGYNEYDVFAAFKAGVKHREQLKQL